MLPFNASAVIAGQLLGIAFAAGLNLYATVAVLGAAARFGLIAPLPPGLRGLSNALVIGSAAGLFLAELVIEKLPVVGAIWSGAHALIRPAGAALLTFLAFGALPTPTAAALAAAVGLFAFAAHGAKTGLRVMLASTSHPRSAVHTAAAALALDILAIGTALATLLNPTAATAVGLATVLFLFVAGPRLWLAAIFGARALEARLAGLFRQSGWKTASQLPGYIRQAVIAAPIAHAAPRATRVAALGLPGAAAYRNGWLIFDAGGPCFIFRAPFVTRRLPLPEIRSAELRAGRMADALRITTSGRHFTLFLLKDGPPPAHVVAELTRPH